jgi:hypothetical protein
MSDTLTSLVKKIDQATADNKGCRMGSFVVLLNDDESLEKQLKELADKEKLQKVVLTIDNKAGPASWKIAKDADVTVILYTKHSVKANYSFKKGELKDADVDKIVADVAKIVPDKKDKKDD